MPTLPKLIALTGFANAGKDESVRPLFERHGYVRHNFGNIIKRQLDDLIQRHFHFSAFTEDRSQKERIRRTLENWGEDNYEAILDEFLATVPPLAVNTRLCRVKEAVAWKERGGVIIEVHRPGRLPVTQWEYDRLEELRETNMIDDIVWNEHAPYDLHVAMMETLYALAARRSASAGAAALAVPGQ